MKFLIDSMLPPGTARHLATMGHDATTPTGLGAHNLPDDALIQLAAAGGPRDRHRERKRLRPGHRVPSAAHRKKGGGRRRR